jgi:hypothetical protein
MGATDPGRWELRPSRLRIERHCDRGLTDGIALPAVLVATSMESPNNRAGVVFMHIGEQRTAVIRTDGQCSSPRLSTFDQVVRTARKRGFQSAGRCCNWFAYGL